MWFKISNLKLNYFLFRFQLLTFLPLKNVKYSDKKIDRRTFTFSDFALPLSKSGPSDALRMAII